MKILSDNPVESLIEDKQKRKELVHQLTESLINLPSSESIVYGLYGPWGAGKSSFLNFLEKDLQSKEQSVLRFDPWYFSSNEKLIMSFFLSLSEIIRSLLNNSCLSDEFEKEILKYVYLVSPIELNATIHPSKKQGLQKIFHKTFSGGINPQIFNIGGQVSVETIDNNPYYLKEEIKRILADLKKRVYIFIDNIDRLDGDEILMIFKLVRLCADFPMLTFVLSFDRDYVTRVISDRLATDEDYLRKIIQVDVDLPLYDLSTIDSFFFSALEDFANQLGIRNEVLISQRFVNLYYSNLKGIFIKDFRSLKRYLNAISISIPLVIGEVNYCDFLIVELLRVFAPKLYSLLPLLELHLTSFDGLNDLEVQRKTRTDSFDKLIKMVEALGENTPHTIDGVLDLLGDLFPIFGHYFQNPNNPRRLIRGDHLDSFNKNSRICSPNYFEIYFSYSVKSGELSGEERIHLIEKVRNGSLSSDLRIIPDAKIKGKLFQTLYFLTLNLDSFSEIQLSELIIEICSSSNLLEDTSRIQLLDREFYQAVSLVIESIRLLTKEQRDINIRHVINNSTSLRFTIQILYFVRETMPDVSIDDFQLELANKILEMIKSDDTSILFQSPKSLLATLNFLRGISSDLLQGFDIRVYLAVAFRKQPDKVPNFLSLFVSLTLDEQPVEFHMEDVELFVDSQTLLEILNDNQVYEPVDQIELFALNRFREAMRDKGN